MLSFTPLLHVLVVSSLLLLSGVAVGQDGPAPGDAPASVDADAAVPAPEDGVETEMAPTGVDGVMEGAPLDPTARLDENLAQAGTAFEQMLRGDFSPGNLLVLWTTVGWPITLALILIVISLLVARLAKAFVTKVAKKARIETTLAKFFGNIARYVVLVLAATAILNTFGVDMTVFAGVLAALGFAIGLALSGTLSNFACGVFLMIFRPFRVGDVVATGGITAKVHEIELFTTTFDTPDNRRIIVPNNEIFGKTIENITHHKTRRVDISVGTAYAADIDRTREVLEQVVRSVEGVQADPAPVVYLNELGASSVNWALRAWAPTPDYWAVRERLMRTTKVALDEAGIGIPYPQMDVTIVNRG